MTRDCDCSVDVDCYPSCYREQQRTARKSHECCECHEPIVAGQKYEYASGVWDGSPGSYRTCLPCARIRDHYCAHGFILGSLRTQLQDCLGFDYLTAPEPEDCREKTP
jgi:hypothetical protein